MAVPPKLAGHRLAFAPPAPSTSSVPPATHTLEVFLDYACPFSAKMFRGIQDVVSPLVRDNKSWASLLTIVFRQQVQPWHPSSTLMHEAALAVLATKPEKFWEFSRLLFDRQTEYFDVNVVNETRNQTYKRLAKLASKIDLDETAIYDLLVVSDQPGDDGALNVGNKVTADVKLVTKMHRLVGTHVTPTVIYDGVVQPSIESSFGPDQWQEWLSKNVV